MYIQSFQPISDKNSKILIVGTMPGNESLRKGEYYAHQSNHFWDIMFRILIDNYSCFELVQETETYEKKVELLLNNGIALWDTLKYCDRKGNLDKEIRNEIINDFDSFFEVHKGILKVFFNGKKAHKYFIDSFKHLVDNRKIELVILNSTSSNNPNNVFGILNEWRKEIKNAI